MDLQRHYVTCWKASDEDTRRRLEEKVRLAEEARSDFARRLMEIDEERESKAASAREQIEQYKRILEEARENATADMEAKLAEKRRILLEKTEQERGRCGKMRGQHLRKAEDYMREVMEYKTNIEKLSENYRAKQVSQPLSRLISQTTTPRGITPHLGGLSPRP